MYFISKISLKIFGQSSFFLSFFDTILNLQKSFKNKLNKSRILFPRFTQILTFATFALSFLTGSVCLLLFSMSLCFSPYIHVHINMYIHYTYRHDIHICDVHIHMCVYIHLYIQLYTYTLFLFLNHWRVADLCLFPRLLHYGFCKHKQLHITPVGWSKSENYLQCNNLMASFMKIPLASYF